MTNRSFVLLATGIVLLALAIRLQYVLAVQLVNPLGGDAMEYVAYAKSLSQGYFGHDGISDAYRSPGYPATVAAAMALGEGWPLRLLLWQAVMGAATVGFTIALARRWMPAWGAVLAGLLLAFWPHHIAFTAEVLGEIQLGFCLTGALLLTVLAMQRKSWRWGIGAGLAWGLAYLVNPIVALLPLVIAVVVWRQANTRVALATLLPLLLVAGLWSVRPVEGGSERIWINLVQGSWPLYHRAYVSRNAHPEPQRIMETIDAETALMLRDRNAGFGSMSLRIKEDPGHYAKWYASKAFLLWDWDVRISDAFGPYVHIARGSTLEQPPLSVAAQVLRFLNPLIFWISLGYALIALLRGPAEARILALSFAYFTAVHLVLQAEPRYSIPYRPIEILLFVGALCWLVQLARGHRHDQAAGTSEKQ